MTSLKDRLADIRSAVHASCNHRQHPCRCICECDESIACDCWLGDLCSVCQIRWGRDDDDHGLPEESGLTT